MAEDDLQKRRKKGRGLFGRKKKKKESSSYDDRGSVDSTDEGRRKKKKKRFGARIKRLMGGRRRKKKNADDASEISLIDKDDPNYKGPRTSLDPDILAAVMEKDVPRRKKGYNDLEDDLPGPPRGKFDDIPEEDEEDEMMEGEDEGLGDGKGDLANPMSLVLLLVDAETLRFELLQLEFESPQDAKVADVLDQIKGSVTEPAIQTLEFHGLVDRKGGLFRADSPLAKAVTNRRRSRDILVGVSKGVTTEHCSRLARPILGDSKVIEMLELNGYDVRGWAKGKREEAELRDAKMKTLKSTERKRQLRAFTLVILAALAMLFFQNGGHVLFRSIPSPLERERIDVAAAEAVFDAPVAVSSETESNAVDGVPVVEA